LNDKPEFFNVKGLSVSAYMGLEDVFHLPLLPKEGMSVLG
jgi:hypothetical protein